MAAAAFTQLSHLTAVPGFHFDEAWQGLYAWRIASEAGFWPLEAMNGYTSPVPHYFLAAVFQVFEPTLAALRGAFAALNFASLGIWVHILRARAGKGAAAWFAALWALLPLLVHQHRFYIEVTAFFAFCFSLSALGVHLWKRHPRTAMALVVAPTIAALASHILYAAPILAAAWVAAAQNLRKDPRVLKAFLPIAAAGLVVSLRAYLSLRKPSALAFVAAFAALPIILHFDWGAQARRLRPVLALAAVVYGVAYVLLFWNGPWPYSQVTGRNGGFWLPVNLALLAYAGHCARKARLPGAAALLGPFALASFVLCSVMVFKQTPRYYMVPTMALAAWAAVSLSSTRQKAAAKALALIFVCWNSYAFVARYLLPFQSRGATGAEFKSLVIFKDTARDFRPFQKVFAWLEEQGCGQVIRAVEDDRFLRPIEFLQLTAKDPAQRCPWSREQLIFRTVPENPKEWDARLRLLHREASWGDLGLWLSTQVR